MSFLFKSGTEVKTPRATMNRIVAGFCEATIAASTATTSSTDFETTSRHYVVACGRQIL